MLKIFFASLFALVFNQGIFIFGLSMTSPIDASIVTTTLPIVTMIVAAIYLKEPITNKKVLGSTNQFLYLSDGIQRTISAVFSGNNQ